MFTSESVTRGHPDKLCDQISDAVVGNFLRQDPNARVMAECAVSTGVVFLSVKFRAHASVDVGDVARGVIRSVGYEADGFNAKSCSIMTSLSEFSPLQEARSNAAGNGEERTVEDQATLFGFACDHTPTYMPAPIVLAHALARGLDSARRKQLPYLAPDGKTQVGIEFKGRRPYRIHSVTILASQRDADRPSPRALEMDLRDLVLAEAFAGEELRPDPQTRIAINPEGPIVRGGPAAHAGLTGRKTAVDTYGEFARHGGAALSGKDLARIDRIGAYAARQAARAVIAAGLAELCEVQLSYSIGLPGPVSVQVETYGTGRLEEAEIARRVQARFDFRIGPIIERLRLRELTERDGGFLRELSAYGHFGRRDLALPWEADVPLE
ncbi:MAG TPA: methionine adenosyltransferase [Polyangiaceae bacterium]|nr:methionine adenosyltransferase [Polyangiaceae bacterium]